MAWTKELIFCLWKWSVMVFIWLSFHLCAPGNGVQITFSSSLVPIEVNVTQKFYQAEKNHNITLDFSFTTKPECSQNVWVVLCRQMKVDKVLYHYVEFDGDTASECEDERFSGRVLFDKDVLRKGQIRLHVSRLRTEDSGFYVCELKIGRCRGSDTCNLVVTDMITTVHPSEIPSTISPPAESRGGTGLFIVAAATVVTILIICYIIYRKKNNSDGQPLWPRRQTVSS
ncbi:uncharacterized protein LOC122820562 isoform X2 [Gambusia affinis]|uniref:uncharacterized protein LOC122820562 isoform X1 n=1 Tax=Gambusia affinis TaxID=33528 RepID=UPI001CDCD331|nr:uncharacterized protein LOC122820562 isoform X1 [Gambusia affinis]XP_043954046.1 uncharacterized protein LOC122820562 isoform X2 [Gambusia affinis]